MVDKGDVKSKPSANLTISDENVITGPVRKCHFLDKKYFVVIDNSIIERINVFDTHNLYFKQELNEDGCVILRPYKME